MWREITENDVLQSVSAPERDAIQTAAVDESQPLPIASVILTAVADARGRIAAYPPNALSEGPTVPETLVHHVVAIIRWRLLTRLPVKSLATEARQLEYKEALNALEAVANGKYSIEQPTSPDPEPRKQIRPSISARRPKFRPGQQDGI